MIKQNLKKQKIIDANKQTPVYKRSNDPNENKFMILKKLNSSTDKSISDLSDREK